MRGVSLTLAGQDRNHPFFACFLKCFQVLFIMLQIVSKHSATIREIKAPDIRYIRADESTSSPCRTRHSGCWRS